jgi:hypothetical protein
LKIYYRLQERLEANLTSEARGISISRKTDNLSVKMQSLFVNRSYRSGNIWNMLGHRNIMLKFKLYSKIMLNHDVEKFIDEDKLLPSKVIIIENFPSRD